MPASSSSSDVTQPGRRALRFHVDNHSSAHVYLRLPKGDTISDVPDDIVAECSQLTKANSIEGSKLSHVRIIYTQWSNLKKTEGMADGQVGYHNRTAVRFHMVEHRINAVVNRLNKTKVEKHNNPNELRELRTPSPPEPTTPVCWLRIAALTVVRAGFSFGRRSPTRRDGGFRSAVGA